MRHRRLTFLLLSFCMALAGGCADEDRYHEIPLTDALRAHVAVADRVARGVVDSWNQSQPGRATYFEAEGKPNRMLSLDDYTRSITGIMKRDRSGRERQAIRVWYRLAHGVPLNHGIGVEGGPHHFTILVYTDTDETEFIGGM